MAAYGNLKEGTSVTNYQSTTFYVEDSNDDSAAFTPLADNGEHALKMWRTAFLPDGQPVEVNVLFTDEDVRGLQAFLNDQFGRGKSTADIQQSYPYESGDVLVLGPQIFAAMNGQVLSWEGKNYVPQGVTRLPDTAEDVVRTAVHNLQAQGYSIIAPDGTPGVYVADISSTREAGWGTAIDGAATWNPIEAQQVAEPRQCPVIYNGVQCSAVENHDFDHQFTIDWTTVQPTPQTGDEAVSPPVDQTGQQVFAHLGSGAAAESAPVAQTTEAPSLSDPGPAFSPDDTADTAGKPERKKSNRRKKEEKAYDDALATFRANPNSQLEYVALTNAAEALRKRFPNADRLEAYDEHVRLQNVQVLLDPQNLASHRTPEEQAAWEANQKPANAEDTGPHFAPEQPSTQPTPFIPPAEGPQSAEELQAAQAFPCQHVSEISGRQCTRPSGHELANPPKPHIYGELQPGQELPQPSFVPVIGGPGHNADGFPVESPFQQPGFTSTPVGQPAQDGSGFTQATIPPFQIPQPTTTVPPTQGTPAPALSFQIPPTPDGADLQPPAPAAPPWGGQ